MIHGFSVEEPWYKSSQIDRSNQKFKSLPSISPRRLLNGNTPPLPHESVHLPFGSHPYIPIRIVLISDYLSDGVSANTVDTITLIRSTDEKSM